MQNHFVDFKSYKVVGNIGHPNFPVLLSTIHNAAFKLLGLNYIYVPFDVPPQNIETAIRGLISLGIAGVNVTLPHNEIVMKFLDEVAGEASMSGFVNTIVNEGERLIGYNTNINGMVETLKPYKEEIFDQQITIFGSGNISRVLIYTLVKHYRPKNIFIVNRDLQKAEKLRKYAKDELKYNQIKILPFTFEEILPTTPKSKMIINATPVGMFPKIDECVMESDAIFNENQIVVDLIYNPKSTRFLQTAQKKNARIVSGLEILLNQAAKTFELWTNLTMPLDDIRKILDEIQKS